MRSAGRPSGRLGRREKGEGENVLLIAAHRLSRQILHQRLRAPAIQEIHADAFLPALVRRRQAAVEIRQEVHGGAVVG